jgi:hypothetical protein
MNPRDMITYCGTTYHERLGQSLECVKRVSPFVDRVVLVQNDFQGQDEEILEEACKCPIDIISKPWIDHFSAYRNRYLSAVKDGWFLVSDPDEWFSEDACKSLRSLIEESRFGSRYNIVAFNAVDTMYSDDYKQKLASNRSTTWFKQLLFKHYPGMYYSGQAGGIVHEQMIHPPNLPIRAINAPPEMYYEHVKSKFEQTERGVRNFWIGGGGINDMGHNFPDWKMLHDRMFLDHNVSSWQEFKAFLKAGKLPKWLDDWIRGHEHYEDPKDSPNPIGSEVRELYMLYFDYFHPEQK